MPSMEMIPHSPSFVIGSFQSCRTLRGFTSRSSPSEFGYRPNRRRKMRIPSAYWSPRKTSSASFSRWAWAEASGRTAAMRIDATVIPTRSATRV